MATCEDAPCCGCCGTSLYGSEVPAFESYDEDYYYERMEERDEEECDPRNGYCVTDTGPDGCRDCRDYWLDFHADGLNEWLDGSWLDGYEY